MGDGAELVQKGDPQRAMDADVAAAPALIPCWALGTATAMKGALGALGAGKVENPLPAAQKWVMDKQESFSLWLNQQPIAVETAISSALAAVQGAAAGALVSTFSKDIVRSVEAVQRASMDLDPNVVINPWLSPKGAAIGPSPIVQARNFAVLTGTNAGISCILKRVRGVDDMENSLVAAFGSGFLYELVSSRGAPNIASAVGTGAFFALIQGGYYKVSQMMSKDKKTAKKGEEDAYYAKTRSMLTTLGLGRYEKNFRKGMLTDYTLPLLTDRQGNSTSSKILLASALRDVKIPPGPRLMILDHVQ
ncbi:hypothetical protein Taro_024697, partial [Colocasia esculenta]|nr:hypothetical protein [Colocasia esculenta]